MFTPDARVPIIEEKLKEKKAELELEATQEKIIRDAHLIAEQLREKRNKILVNHIIENFEKYFNLESSEKIGRLGRVQETWETVRSAEIKLSELVIVVEDVLLLDVPCTCNKSHSPSCRLGSLFHLFEDYRFETMFIEKLSTYGWNVYIPHRAGCTREFTFVESNKSLLSRYYRKWFGKSETNLLCAPKNGPYRTLEEPEQD